MNLLFMGDAGVYLPHRDAIQFTALDGDRPVLCLVTLAGLVRAGANPTDSVERHLSFFSQKRRQFEQATRAVAATRPSHTLVVDVDDLDPALFRDGGSAPQPDGALQP
jgi:hypothetical protein